MCLWATHVDSVLILFHLESMQEDVDAFLEESVVRRELSDNYCFYVPNYDSIDACYDWAKDTLNKHRNDKRDPLYTQ